MKADFLLQKLYEMGIRTIAGVPDSTLKQLCDEIQLDHGRRFGHYVTANEGAAVGLAAGEYLASGRPCCIYMQNSGIGNIINPAASIANRAVYGIPMLFVIGWRGEPGIKDEPQHVFQGRITCELLQIMDIRYSVIDAGTTDRKLCEILKEAEAAFAQDMQYAIVVKKDTFEKGQPFVWENGAAFVREQALKTILEEVYEDSFLISTTGKISRELYEQSDRLFGNHDRLFMSVGGMGHASMIAFGMAQADKNRNIVCIDGDGALLMHMGSLAFIAGQSPDNYLHIVINNASHESVGAMPTGFSGKTYAEIAKACGYPHAWTVYDEETLRQLLHKAKERRELTMIEVMVSLDSRKDLGRPRESARDNKIQFMDVCRK